MYKVDSETNKAYIKYRLITYDNDLNIIYKKDLTDWEEAASEEDLNYTQDIEFKDNNTIVALNYKDKVVLVVLDAEGNIIKDLSNEVRDLIKKILELVVLMLIMG